jgi:hypothetical protein
MICRNGGVQRDLVDAGLAPRTRTLTSLVPPLFSGPSLAYHSPPFSMTSGTLAMVSTLLTIVGQPNRPTTAGKWGLEARPALLPPATR